MINFPVIWSAQEAREHRADAREQTRLATKNLQNIQFGIEAATSLNKWQITATLCPGTTEETARAIMGYLKSKGYTINTLFEQDNLTLEIGWNND